MKSDLGEIRWRILASTKITESPDGIPRHGESGWLCEKSQERLKDSLLKDVVSAFGGVSGNVTKSPNSLFLNQSWNEYFSFFFEKKIEENNFKFANILIGLGIY